MKKYLLAVVAAIVCVVSARGQSADARLEQMMTKRVLTERDVIYNIASLTPGLYKAGKYDTVRQLVSYYERNYGNGVLVVPMRILLDIKDREFKEGLVASDPFRPGKVQSELEYETQILGLLSGFSDVCEHMVQPNYYSEEQQSHYIPYLSLIGSIADSLKRIPDLKPAERYLLNFYAHPSDTLLRVLERFEYNGTVIQRAWLTAKADRAALRGFSVGVASGVWAPTGNLSLLGPKPYLGFVIGGRAPKYSIELAMLCRFLNSANPYLVNEGDTLYTTQHHFGFYGGLDGMYELAGKRRNRLEALGGLGIDVMDVLSTTGKTKAPTTKTLASVNINAGLGYRLILTDKGREVVKNGRSVQEVKRSYLSVQVKYQYLHYNNKGGTPLDGGGWLIGLVYGAYGR